MSYNGYKNWGTWNTMLWVDNDMPIYHRTLGYLQRNMEHLEHEELANELMHLIVEHWPKGTPDMVRRGMHWANAQVCWWTVLENQLEALGIEV